MPSATGRDSARVGYENIPTSFERLLSANKLVNAKE